MSRLRRQDNKGWINEGPRASNPSAVGWSLGGHREGPTPQSRVRGRDFEDGARNYEPREMEVVS